MASQLTPILPIWHDSLTIIDPDDPVQGGVDGIDNTPHIELAQNDMWLKTELAKALERITVLENKTPTTGTTTPTPSTGGTTTPIGSWKFSYALARLAKTPADVYTTTIGRFTSPPLPRFCDDIYFDTDLPKVARKIIAIGASNPTTIDGYSNRVLIYVSKLGEQPDFSQLPVANNYQGSIDGAVLDFRRFEINDDGKVHLGINGSSNFNGASQAEYKGILGGMQTASERRYDVHYVFLLDEKSDNLLTNEQIIAQQWGKHHIEKITFCDSWNDGYAGAYTVEELSITPPDTSQGGNMASIEA